MQKHLSERTKTNDPDPIRTGDRKDWNLTRYRCATGSILSNLRKVLLFKSNGKLIGRFVVYLNTTLLNPFESG